VATPERARAEIDRLTDSLGADVAVEAVGIPETFEQCTELIRPGGRVANVGVHGKPATLHLESLWIKGVTITTGLVDTFSTPTLLKSVAAGQIDPTRSPPTASRCMKPPRPTTPSPARVRPTP
jgi:alcohol dehydrogenase